jgi:hypothetical protein
VGVPLAQARLDARAGDRLESGAGEAAGIAAAGEAGPPGGGAVADRDVDAVPLPSVRASEP